MGGGLLAVTAIGFLLAYQFVGPPPPDALVMVTVVEGDAYHAFGERCREALARSGIELELRQTAGSLENLDAIRAGEADVDATC